MPQVDATPMMILHMEMASGSAIASHLPERFCQRRHKRENPSPCCNAGWPHGPRHFPRYQDHANGVVFEVEASRCDAAFRRGHEFRTYRLGDGFAQNPVDLCPG